jgi:hypothetical protein
MRGTGRILNAAGALAGAFRRSDRNALPSFSSSGFPESRLSKSGQTRPGVDIAATHSAPKSFVVIISRSHETAPHMLLSTRSQHLTGKCGGNNAGGYP